MSKKLTTEEFIRKAKHIHGDKYDYSLVVYMGYYIPITIICPIHGKFEQLPSHHLYEKGCKQCGRINIIIKRSKWTKEDCLKISQQFITKKDWLNNDKGSYRKAHRNGWLEECCKNMIKLGNNYKRCVYAYEFENVNGCNYVYVGLTHDTNERDKKHKVKGSLFKFCEKYDLEFTTPKQLSEYINEEDASKLEGFILEQYINDGWVPINKAKTGGLGGGSNQKQRGEMFIKKGIIKHKDEYDYSEVVYINSKTNVWLIHKKCGYKFKQLPEAHLRGHGCHKCGGGMKYTREEFIEKAKHIHGNKYDYSLVHYVNNITEVCIICPIHGEFWQKPTIHLKGCDCNECGKIRNGEKHRKK